MANERTLSERVTVSAGSSLCEAQEARRDRSVSNPGETLLRHIRDLIIVLVDFLSRDLPDYETGVESTWLWYIEFKSKEPAEKMRRQAHQRKKVQAFFKIIRFWGS